MQAWERDSEGKPSTVTYCQALIGLARNVKHDEKMREALIANMFSPSHFGLQLGRGTDGMGKSSWQIDGTMSV